jgi:hypothetical protein
MYPLELRLSAIKAYDLGVKPSAILHIIRRKQPDSPINKETIRKWCTSQKDYILRECEIRGIHAEPLGVVHQKPVTVAHKNKQSVVLAIPDLHCPFQHQDALAFLCAVRDKFKPTTIVCLGDEIDAHALSRYPKDPNGMSAGQEMSKAREALIPFYLEFPEVLVCESNHTVRGHKKAFEAGLPSSFMHHIATILNAPDGWSWKSRHEVDGVLYIHGDAGKSGYTAHINYVKAFKKSVVIGHIHSFAGVNYEGNLFGMNTGCLIDVEAYCFAYARHMPINVNLGCGLIIEGNEAYFIPMKLDLNGRWTGRLHS